MTKVYACLAGNWVCLNDDPACTVGINHQTPYDWWKEGTPLYAPVSRDKERVHIFFQGQTWRISPIFIQIVTE